MIHRVLEQFELIGLFLLCALNILNAGLNLVEEHERVVGVIAGRGGRPHDDVVGDVDLHAGEECLLVVLEVAREALESLRVGEQSGGRVSHGLVGAAAGAACRELSRRVAREACLGQLKSESLRQSLINR